MFLAGAKYASFSFSLQIFAKTVATILKFFFFSSYVDSLNPASKYLLASIAEELSFLIILPSFTLIISL